ncbi:hypothetical protein EYV94_25380 [Puteibacter caeruleilacunae]|nr:hypothetical protein EYV94_25380 [Puteibacter caeruleilacunae]
MRKLYTIIFVLGMLLSACEQDPLTAFRTDKTKQQIIAENMSATWIRPEEIKTPQGVRGDIISSDMRLMIRVSNNGEGNGVFYAYKVPMLFYPKSTSWQWANAETVEDIVVEGENNPIKNVKLELFDDNRKLKVSFDAKWRDTSSNTGEGTFQFILNRQ